MSGTTMAAAPLAGRRFRHHRKLRQLAAVPFRGTAGYSSTVADLKGKRVGVAGFGLGAHRGAQIILAKLGLQSRYGC